MTCHAHHAHANALSCLRGRQDRNARSSFRSTAPSPSRRSQSAIPDSPHTRRRAVMFAGPAGTGKTKMLEDRLHTLDPEVYSVREIHLNACTDAEMLQRAMEVALERRTAKIVGAPGAKRLVCMLDDINMPQHDVHGTQQVCAVCFCCVGGICCRRIRHGTEYRDCFDVGFLIFFIFLRVFSSRQTSSFLRLSF